MSTRGSVRWVDAPHNRGIVGAFVAMPFAPSQFINAPWWFIWLVPIICGFLLLVLVYSLLRPWIERVIAQSQHPSAPYIRLRAQPVAAAATVGQDLWEDAPAVTTTHSYSAALSGVGSVAPEAAPVAKSPEVPRVATSAEELQQWEAEKHAPTSPTAGPPPVVDDLELIEGIGPKIAGIFTVAGITTFAQLAAADIDHLKGILHAAGMRLGDPSTWPAQARLAADGDWEGLKQLQDSLKSGR